MNQPGGRRIKAGFDISGRGVGGQNPLPFSPGGGGYPVQVTDFWPQFSPDFSNTDQLCAVIFLEAWSQQEGQTP